ncbi:TIGR03032 family protein [Gloeobacter violaceus]|uniref:Gll1503 protein n=1 Tax=Gloeobacter violaceus (strain ATCC 29082 / PCC 7421) TaxID=251221 RepID=Q7NKH5_GLOVI|nr:TIGR03032 family protein [Gloeobacter violaceus]BAC89444.1 gll1503 [Gloeobacter violaceus PCC 7421]
MTTSNTNTAATTDAANASAGEAPVTFVHSPSFAELLDRLGVTLALTTYQAGKLCFISTYQNRLRLLMRTYNKAMGLFPHDQGMVLATRNQIWSFVKAPELLAAHYPDRDYDNLYLPQCSFVTGDVAAHDVFLLDGEIHLVNTLFSCLARVSRTRSFVPTWKPSFISRLAPEDRCHFNSVALDNGRPRYAVALGATDYAAGWRADKNNGGCAIDIASNEVIYKGFAMPHSPRLYQRQLWVLNSGRGELGTLDVQAGKWQPIVQLPGFLRGLGIWGWYAFVGLSKVREKATFGGTPIDNSGSLQCGVQVVNLKTGTVEAWLTFDTGIEEIYDVQLINGCRHPFVLGFQKEDINRVFNYQNP